jgi:tRNA threonylcarbamoyladenosine biosynthesis protein TsaE
MLTYTWSLTSSQETQRLAMSLANVLLPGDVIAAEGNLGAGKTTFAQGLAQGLGINEPIDSPTFTIIKEYEGAMPFYHMDVYRLEGPEESLGIDEYLEGDGVCYIEWASRIETLLPPETLWLTFTVQSEGKRRLQLKTSLPRVQQWCKGEQA